MLKRDNDKHGTSRLIKILAVATLAIAVASSAIVGTVAAQTSRLFEDVPRGHYAHDSIEWAVENKITVGCGDGTNFCPTRTLNRAERSHSSSATTTSSTRMDRADRPDRVHRSTFLNPTGLPLFVAPAAVFLVL